MPEITRTAAEVAAMREDGSRIVITRVLSTMEKRLAQA